MWVKICGNTNLEDAQLAGELGADAVGFVFAPSARQVTRAQVARITPHLPEALERVGVFPAWSADEIAAAVLDGGLSTAQLHGGLDLRVIDRLTNQFGASLRIIQAVHWTVDEDQSSARDVADQLRQVNSSRVTRVLVDSKIGSAMGGTGVVFNWKEAQTVFLQETGGLKLILAGGLTPDNVGVALEQLNPWGVDVASGVEAVAGRKDGEKMARFIEAVKSLLAKPHALKPDQSSRN